MAKNVLSWGKWIGLVVLGAIAIPAMWVFLLYVNIPLNNNGFSQIFSYGWRTIMTLIFLCIVCFFLYLFSQKNGKDFSKGIAYSSVAAIVILGIMYLKSIPQSLQIFRWYAFVFFILINTALYYLTKNKEIKQGTKYGFALSFLIIVITAIINIFLQIE